MIGQSGNNRRNHHTSRNSCGAKWADSTQTRLRGGGAWFEHALQIGIERGDGDVYCRCIACRELAEKIDISRDETVLCDDRHWVAKFCEHFETTACDAQLFLNRLVRIGHAAHHEHLRFPTRRLQFRAQQFRGIRFHDDFALKIEPGGKTEIFVSWSGITVNAAVLAAAIWIQT